MSENNIHLNIVSFDIPYPPNYGGVIDVYYKLEALKNAGIQVIFHAFVYGRQKSDELEALCEKVYYYRRKRFGNLFNLQIPYVVKTRKSDKLLNNLCNNPYPLLFEGLHTCFYLGHRKLSDRLQIVRMHNIEYVYYKHLAKVETNTFKRSYFNIEANRLKKFQKRLELAAHVAAISPSDYKILNLKHRNSFYLPVFHQNKNVTAETGYGEFVLYHGNLGIGENNEAALFIVNKVAGNSKIPFIIAGNNPSKELIKAISDSYNVEWMNPNIEELNRLIKEAHINILPTFQDTGIKLKLLNALFMGRHVLVNPKMVNHTGLEELCEVANSPKHFRMAVENLMKKPITKENIEFRKVVLREKFDNQKNIKLLIQKLTRN